MASSDLSSLAAPAVLALIGFLAYSSQFLFRHIDPGPLTQGQSIYFNTLLVCMLISYARSCLVNPGTIPKDWATKLDEEQRSKLRWCRKCEAPKPPRAHHCKKCRRCIPRMDHHCPWTINCVSHRTFPHFLRFLFFAVYSIWILETYLWTRGSILWSKRYMGAHRGPNTIQLAHLMALFATNTIMLFALGVMLLRSLWILVTNTTTIESWEISRHATLVRRARALGGYLHGPGGQRVYIRQQEFPYDIGLFKNVAQGMGHSNPLMWGFPLAPTPRLEVGLQFEENGFEIEGTVWPPPDPDRMPRPATSLDPKGAFVHGDKDLSPSEQVEAFKARQEEDLRRRGLLATTKEGVRRRRTFMKRYERFIDERQDHDNEDLGRDRDEWSDDQSIGTEGEGEEAWRNEEGERLNDFGVDEDAEFYDEAGVGYDDREDDVPLSKLIEMRKAHVKTN